MGIPVYSSVLDPHFVDLQSFLSVVLMRRLCACKRRPRSNRDSRRCKAGWQYSRISPVSFGPFLQELCTLADQEHLRAAPPPRPLARTADALYAQLFPMRWEERSMY